LLLQFPKLEVQTQEVLLESLGLSEACQQPYLVEVPALNSEGMVGIVPVPVVVVRKVLLPGCDQSEHVASIQVGPDLDSAGIHSVMAADQMMHFVEAVVFLVEGQCSASARTPMGHWSGSSTEEQMSVW
jgi:hypothetical protein